MNGISINAQLLATERDIERAERRLLTISQLQLMSDVEDSTHEFLRCISLELKVLKDTYVELNRRRDYLISLEKQTS